MFWIALDMEISLMGLIIGYFYGIKSKPRLKMTELQNLATLDQYLFLSNC